MSFARGLQASLAENVPQRKPSTLYLRNSDFCESRVICEPAFHVGEVF